MKPLRIEMDNGCEVIARTFGLDQNGVPLCLWGGIFGTHLIWGPLVKRLRLHHPIVIIEYPNIDWHSPLFQSDSFKMESLAVFQKDILSHFGLHNCVSIGWSYGTQVVAEFAQQYPGLNKALIAISGVAGKPFKHISDPIYERIGIRPKFSQTVGWLAKQEEAIGRFRKLMQKTEHPSRWAKRFGLVAPLVDELVMDAIVRDFVEMAPLKYNQYIKMAVNHDARAAVSKLEIPLLGICGTQDKLVPPKRTREFVQKNELADFLLVKGGTHFVPLEYPDLIALKIEDFLRKNHI